MNELEKKFKETMLMSLGLEIDDDCLLIKAISGKKLKFNVTNFNILAHDLAIIAEKEYQFKCSECDTYKQNSTLKNQIANQKYLNRDEVKIIVEDWYGNPLEFADELITAICNLAIPTRYIVDGDKNTTTPIKPTRERIIEVLEDWKVEVKASESKLSQYFDCEDDWTQEDLLKLIASEILGEESKHE
ncbi:MAG: hypothetical protein PHW73_01775 [Atribacterota bacterium]|nr:hypothetical protein [Atribacterota bacterium]